STTLTGATVAGKANAVADFHGEAVVVGSVGRAPLERAAVWVSPHPGDPFRQLPLSGVSSGSSIDKLSAGSPGLFAVGEARGKPAVWSSPNGVRWNQSSEAERLLASSPGADVMAVLASSDAVYLGGFLRNGASIQAALWSSTDGVNWHTVVSARSAFAGNSDRVINSLAEIGTAVVAAGGLRSSRGWIPVAWISPDGASWSQPSPAFAAAP